MSLPTDENIRECAEIRAKRILAEGGNPDWVIARAIHFANRRTHPADTAQMAVSWAILDIPK